MMFLSEELFKFEQFRKVNEESETEAAKKAFAYFNWTLTAPIFPSNSNGRRSA